VLIKTDSLLFENLIKYKFEKRKGPSTGVCKADNPCLFKKNLKHNRK